MLRIPTAVMLCAVLSVHALGAQDVGRRRAMVPLASDPRMVRMLDSLIEAERIAEERARVPPCSSGTATFRKHRMLGRRAPATAEVVLVGTVQQVAGQPLPGANVHVPGTRFSAGTDSLGRYVLRIPGPVADSMGRLELRARAFGYRPFVHRIPMWRGDSSRVDFALCRDQINLSQVTVTGLGGKVVGASITNVQHAGVDEGDIVKHAGDFLVILRRGRLFTIRVGGSTLEPVAMTDAFAPGMEMHGEWYDELLIHKDRVVVIGYSYTGGGTEVNLFRLASDGALRHESTYHLRSDDYYSATNYASRLVDGRLVFYTAVGRERGRPLDASLPAMRQWRRGRGRTGEFGLTSNPRRVYAASRALGAEGVSTVHTITSCSLDLPEFACESTVVLGPDGRVFYVSPTAVFVWTTATRPRAGRDGARAVAYRLPLDGSAPMAIGVRGSPADQFSLLDDGSGFLNVVVEADGDGDEMWRATGGASDLSLLRFPIDMFGDGSDDVPAVHYRPLPSPGEGDFQNRFVGDYLVYGVGAEYWNPREVSGRTLFLTPIRGGGVRALALGHAVDRIEVMGDQAVIAGSDAKALVLSGIDLSGEPMIRQTFRLPGAAQGETRSHGFFYRRDEAGGVIGLPVRSIRESEWHELASTSASVLFVRNDGEQFARVGAMTALRTGSADDGCKASCVDWYGNSRPIFLGDRVFALLGYELVEGKLGTAGIEEVGRLDFAPKRR